jgi:iron complex outermembrane receptor protein
MVRLVLASALGVVLACPALAQGAPSPTPDAESEQGGPRTTGGATDVLSQEIVVTATKKSAAENVQSVPLAVTALGEAQLEANFVRTVQNLSYVMPNVQLESIGTTAGYANFAIRGLGINSSIPSIDPTVGVFVDGVYLGISSGIVFDNFDLEAVEVLRGPQGLLFGRNVTGGAVLLRTTTPGNDLKVNARASLETGLNKTASLSVSGPIVADKLAAKLAVYINDDDGWFRNELDGRSFGKARQLIVRPALNFTPADGVQFIARYEHGRARGDGPAAQQEALFSRDGFRFRINQRGAYRNDWDQATLETNIDVGLGDGVITNIAGYRAFTGTAVSDIDALPTTLFDLYTYTEQSQWSDELRYAGTFGRIEATAGLYYFEQDLEYIEQRVLAGGASTPSGGGNQKQRTFGIFASADWSVTDTLTINAGLRYSYEKKRVGVARLTANGCDLANRTCNITFRDSDTWNALTPKIGLQWRPSAETQVYGYYTRGFRSGGYNLRNTDPAVPPGPFDQETQDSFELGLKQSFGRGQRLNLALFRNSLGGLQREIVVPGPLGVSQVIRNTADARVQGVELEGQFRLAPRLLISGNLGYIDGHYTDIFLDLTGDGMVNAADHDLALPRLSPWTYGIGATYDQPLGSLGVVTARANFSHRDRAAFSDNNVARLDASDILDASLTLAVGRSGLSLSLYGKNLLNVATRGADVQLPASFAGPTSSFLPLNKGRVIGVEAAFKL